MSPRTAQAAVLAWAIPGGGHFFLGHRGLGVVLFLAISFPYWTGMALGGVLTSANPSYNKWLFLSEMGVAGYTAPAYLACRAVEARVRTLSEPDRNAYMSYYPESDVATIYLAAAGLLNLLAVLDVISRATYGLPTYHRHIKPAESARGPS